MKRAHGQRGQALIEFAFIILALALLALGVVDFALAIQQGMLVQEAATAAAQCGSFSTYNASQTALVQTCGSTAGIGATGLAISEKAYCVCSLGGAIITCSTTSCNNDKPQLYIQVTATSSFASLFPYNILPHAFNLNSTVVVEAQ